MGRDDFFEANRRILNKSCSNSSQDFFDANREILNNSNGNKLQSTRNNGIQTVTYMNNVNTLKSGQNLQQDYDLKKTKMYKQPKSYEQIKSAKRINKYLIRRITIGSVVGIIFVSSIALIMNLLKNSDSKPFGDENSSSNVDVVDSDMSINEDSYQEVSLSDNSDDIDSQTEEFSSLNHDDYTYVGYDQSLEEVRNFLNNTDSGYYIYKYSEMYGIDPHIMAAICKIESLTLNHEDCIPGGRFYTGFGVGITELDFDKEYTEEHEVYVVGYNYLTGEEDRVRLNMENAVNLETNIQISAMLFQNNINAMKGNILLAIQCHNFGEPMTRLVLKANGLYDYIEDFSKMKWKDAMLDAHLHPYNYLSNDEWNYEKLGKYGGKNYVDTVLKVCERDATYRYGDTIYTVNLNTGLVIEKQDVKSRSM